MAGIDSASPWPTSPPPLPAEPESRRERRLALGFALLGLLAFGTGAVLDPYDASRQPRSHGTHRQLGLPACAFQLATGVGCPSCGMTTSISLLMHADPAAAWRTNWAGCIVGGLGGIALVWFLAVAAGFPTGRLTADEVVKWMVIAGSTVAGLRWASLLAAHFLATRA